MIGIATPAAQSLANVANGKTPVVMGAISDPIGAGLVRNIKHPGANITGVIHKEPVKQRNQTYQDDHAKRQGHRRSAYFKRRLVDC